jgi:predicted secreted protein
MTTTVGNAGVITIEDDAGSAQTVAEVRNYSIETTSDTIETSRMGNTTRQYVKGLASFSGSADVYWDATHFSTIDLNPTVGSVGATNKVVGLKIYPTGTGTSWNGDIVVTGYSVTGSFDGIIEASISFQGTGSLAYS